MREGMNELHILCIPRGIDFYLYYSLPGIFIYIDKLVWENILSSVTCCRHVSKLGFPVLLLRIAQVEKMKLLLARYLICAIFDLFYARLNNLIFFY